MPCLNFSRPVKVHHPATHFDIQFIVGDDKFDDVGIPLLVCDCFSAKWLAHHCPMTKTTRQSVYLRMNTGSLAIFTAILRASSLVSTLPGLSAYPARFCYYYP